MILNIDSSAIKGHADRLREFHRSAMPVVTRQTLNKAAYDVKQTTMPATAKEAFEERKANFFTASSKVEQATGWDINSMRATVGFIPKADSKDTSVQDLQAQENGGKIDGRSFIPVKKARIGNSWGANIRTKNRWRNVNKMIVDSNDSSAPNNAGKFRSSASWAYANGGLVLGNKENASGNRFVWRVLLKGKIMKLQPVFVVKKDRLVEPAPSHFMKKASLRSATKMERDFIMLAEQKLKQMK